MVLAQIDDIEVRYLLSLPGYQIREEKKKKDKLREEKEM